MHIRLHKNTYVKKNARESRENQDLLFVVLPLRRHKKKHEGLRTRCSNRGLEPESKRLWASHARPETFNQQRQPIKPLSHSTIIEARPSML